MVLEVGDWYDPKSKRASLLDSNTILNAIRWMAVSRDVYMATSKKRYGRGLLELTLDQFVELARYIGYSPTTGFIYADYVGWRGMTVERKDGGLVYKSPTMGTVWENREGVVNPIRNRFEELPYLTAETLSGQGYSNTPPGIYIASDYLVARRSGGKIFLAVACDTVVEHERGTRSTQTYLLHEYPFHVHAMFAARWHIFECVLLGYRNTKYIVEEDTPRLRAEVDRLVRNAINKKGLEQDPQVVFMTLLDFLDKTVVQPISTTIYEWDEGLISPKIDVDYTTPYYRYSKWWYM